MFDPLNTCFLILVVMIGALIALVYVAVRKVKVGEISQADMNQLMPHLDYAFRMRGWQSKWNPNSGKMTVTKDSLVASDIYFRRGPNGKTEILSGVNAGAIGWVLVIVFMFVSGGLIGIVLAIVLHVMSRNFSQNDLVPVIMYVHSNPPVYPQYQQPPIRYGEPQITLKPGA
jgi:uncharacterized ion transporter superfamily protein YfcC